MKLKRNQQANTPGKYSIDIRISDHATNESYFILEVHLAKVLSPQIHQHLIEYIEQITDIIKINVEEFPYAYGDIEPIEDIEPADVPHFVRRKLK